MSSAETSPSHLNRESAFDIGYWDPAESIESYLRSLDAPNFSLTERRVLADVFNNVALQSVASFTVHDHLKQGDLLDAANFDIGTVLLIDYEELRNAEGAKWSKPTLGPESDSPGHTTYLLNCRPADLIRIQINKAKRGYIEPPEIVIRHPEGLKWEYLRRAWFAIVTPGENSDKNLYSFERVQVDDRKIFYRNSFNYSKLLHAGAAIGNTTFADYRDEPDKKINPRYQRLLDVTVITEGQQALADKIRAIKDSRLFQGRIALRHFR